MGGTTVPLPAATLSPGGRELLALIDAHADGGIVETPTQHAQRVNDLRLLWDACERGWERAMATAQGDRVLSFRQLADATGASNSTVADRVRRGRVQQQRTGRSRKDVG